MGVVTPLAIRASARAADPRRLPEPRRLSSCLHDAVARAYEAHGLAGRFSFRGADDAGRPAYRTLGGPCSRDELRGQGRADLAAFLGALADLTGLLGVGLERVSLGGRPAPHLLEALRAEGLDPWREPGAGSSRAVLHWLDDRGRSWPMSWIGLDSSGGSAPSEQRATAFDTPFHASLLGSLEAAAVLLDEQRALPLWLAPEQVRILAVSRAHQDYADELLDALRVAGVRAGALPPEQGPLAGRVRRGVLAGVPCLAIVGQRERAQRTVTLRRPRRERTTLSLSRFVAWAQAESHPTIPNRRYGHSPP